MAFSQNMRSGIKDAELTGMGHAKAVSDQAALEQDLQDKVLIFMDYEYDVGTRSPRKSYIEDT